MNYILLFVLIGLVLSLFFVCFVLFYDKKQDRKFQRSGGSQFEVDILARVEAVKHSKLTIGEQIPEDKAKPETNLQSF